MRSLATRSLLALALSACGPGDAHPSYVPPLDATPDAAAAAAAEAAADAAPDADADADAAADAASSTLRVLFIGNSYTEVNDLPGTLRGLSIAAGAAPAIEVESVTVGGYRLEDHWNGAAARPAIAKGGRAFVVLQGQSVEVFAPTSFEAHAALFADASRAAHATPVFFETWARAAGDAVYAESWSGGTPDAMQDGLLAEYAKVATAGAAKLAPVGEAFREVRLHHATIELIQSDRSHPTAAGTYLAACVFYDVLTGQTFVATGGVPAGVSAATASVLRTVARDAVAAHP